MNNATHTPGPWKAVQHPREHKWAWTIEGTDGVGQSIARMGLVNDAQAVTANAHLIAAAPAMYQAGCLSLDVMERVAMALERMGNEGLRSIVRSAVIEQKAALAQAEGKAL